MYAVANGRVTQGWDPGGGGNWTSLFADDGSYYGYGHAQSFAEGGAARPVRAGDVIAWVNSTGSSTGDHLHFGFRPPGSSSYANPGPLLRDAEVGGRFFPLTITPPPTTKDWFDMATEADLARVVRSVIGVNDGETWNSYDSKYHTDDRTVIVGALDKAGFTHGLRSRPYTFVLADKPEQYVLTTASDGSLRRRQLKSLDERQAFVDIGFINPDLIKVVDPARVAALQAIPAV